MKLNLFKLVIAVLLFSNDTVAQEKEVKLFSDFQFGGNIKIFTGKNFLSDAHKSLYKGFQLDLTAVEYKNFTLGGIYENNVSGVKKPEIAGNFNFIRLNHYAGYIGYKHNFHKFTIHPKILVGDIKTKQKATGYYATNNGNFWGISGQVNYNFSNKFAVFSSIGYNFYTFKVQTTPEYTDYFNKSNALSFSLGLKF